MIAVKAYYDGNAFIPFERKFFKKNQQAFIEKEDEIAADAFSGKER